MTRLHMKTSQQKTGLNCPQDTYIEDLGAHIGVLIAGVSHLVVPVGGCGAQNKASEI